MTVVRRITSDFLLTTVGTVLLVLAGCIFFSTSVSAQSTCVSNPPRGCIWEVIDSFCTHVGACSTLNGCGCVDIFMFSNGCCYVEIGTIIDGGSCRAQGCVTFKQCCLGNCHN
jgi:hypothetical protein